MTSKVTTIPQSQVPFYAPSSSSNLPSGVSPDSSFEDFGEIKRKIAEILGIELSGAWEICDSNPEKNLYMVHYRSTADISVWGHIRGTVVDINKKIIVCESYPFENTALIDKFILPMGVDRSKSPISLRDLYGNEHFLTPDTYKFRYFFEGITIRIFKHDDIVYVTGHRKLDITGSRWSSRLTYKQLYEAVGGPDPLTLFDEDKSYSNMCYIFIIVHPDVLNVSLDSVGNGYLTYLGYKRLWVPSEATYPEIVTDSNVWTSPLITSDMELVLARSLSSELIPSNGYIYQSPDLTIEQVNQILQYGYQTPFNLSGLDIRLWPGESVMVYITPPETGSNIDHGPKKLIKLVPTSYAWRDSIRDNNPNIYNQFFVVYNATFTDTRNESGMNEFKRRFPVMEQYDVDSIVNIMQQDPPLIWPETKPFPLKDDQFLKTWNGRYYNIWACFIMAMPLHRRYEATLMYQKLLSDRDLVVTWLRHINNSDELSDPNISRRAKTIISDARNDVRQQTASRDTPPNKSFYDQTNIIIQKWVYREEGRSLYRLTREAREFYRTKEEDHADDSSSV